MFVWKKDNIWDILHHVTSMLTRIRRLTRTFGKVKWKTVAIFSAFCNQRGFCMWFVCRCHLLKKLSILHTSLMWSTLNLFKCVTFSLLIQTHLICSYSKNSFRKVPGICCWFFLPCLNIKSQSITEKRKHDHKVGTYTFINIS